MVESGFSSERIFTVYNSLDYNLYKKLYEEKVKAFSDWQNGKKEVDYKWFYIDKCKTYENMFHKEEIV